MKKGITILVLFTILSTNAQENLWKAEYFTKIIVKDKLNKIDVDSNSKDPEFDKMVAAAMKKASEKQYTLLFNKTESVYEENQSLDKPKPQNGEFEVFVTFSVGGKKYLNIKEKIEIIEDEIFDKEYLILNSLKTFNWELKNEIKKIGEYTCYKAVVTIPVSEKEIQEYKDYVVQNEKKPTLFKKSEPKPKIVIAWYAPEIPMSFGPNNYWGLPGLILEINEDEMIILCTKVQFGNKIIGTVKAPNKGEKVSQEQFDKIQKEKFDSMKDENGNVIFSTEIHD